MSSKFVCPDLTTPVLPLLSLSFLIGVGNCSKRRQTTSVNFCIHCTDIRIKNRTCTSHKFVMETGARKWRLRVTRNVGFSTLGIEFPSVITCLISTVISVHRSCTVHIRPHLTGDATFFGLENKNLWRRWPLDAESNRAKMPKTWTRRR